MTRGELDRALAALLPFVTLLARGIERGRLCGSDF